jgi:hypothetical protein
MRLMNFMRIHVFRTASEALTVHMDFACDAIISASGGISNYGRYIEYIAAPLAPGPPAAAALGL